MKQIQEVQFWRQVRGLAGAVTCETRDLGIKWPHWYTLIFEGEIRVDTRHVCPKDVLKMLLQRARTVHWKKWAAKHEIEELKEGAWLELALALLRKKMKGDWTGKYRNVARKLVLEGGWVQNKLFDIGWSDESECQACHKEEGTEKHRLYHCPKKEWKWQRGIVPHPLSESPWNRGHFNMKKLESEKHKNWGVPAEGFKAHVAADGSLLGRAGKWGARGWAVVQLDF